MREIVERVGHIPDMPVLPEEQGQMLYIDFVGACAAIFCWCSIGHAPTRYNLRLLLFGVLGILPLVISIALKQ